MFGIIRYIGKKNTNTSLAWSKHNKIFKFN